MFVPLPGGLGYEIPREGGKRLFKTLLLFSLQMNSLGAKNSDPSLIDFSILYYKYS